jgi:hypothetical protein
MTQRGARRQVVIFLTRDEWQVLTALAVAAERDQYQQARWLLVQKLRESESPSSDLDEEPERALTAS